MPRDTAQVNIAVVNNHNTLCAQCTPASVNMRSLSQPANIEFTILTPNYSFPTGSPFGITITSGGTEFSGYTRVSGTEVTVVDTNSDGVDYTYTVTVDDGNGNSIVSDPMILNR